MIDQEADNSSQATLLASTRKGVGTALAEKVMRRAPLAADHDRLKPFIKTYNLNECMDFGDRVVVEIPQGFSLGINSGLAYPYCTSRDVTVSQGLADAAIHPSYLGESMMCVRTFPIRVGNIKDGDNQIGWSGPCYPDQHETSFDHLGVEPELTTVTKRVRRIFTWSNKQFRLACSINRPTQICLNFTNYNRSVEEFINLVNSMDKAYKSPTHFGMGPAVEEVTTDEQDVIAMLKKKQHVA
jgi:adenylosuccinate synthase